MLCIKNHSAYHAILMKMVGTFVNTKYKTNFLHFGLTSHFIQIALELLEVVICTTICAPEIGSCFRVMGQDRPGNETKWDGVKWSKFCGAWLGTLPTCHKPHPASHEAGAT